MYKLIMLFVYYPCNSIQALNIGAFECMGVYGCPLSLTPPMPASKVGYPL